MSAGVWKGRWGVWRVLKWPSLLAEPSLSFMDYNVQSSSSGRSLPEHGSTSMTNLHQKPGCLQALAPLAGTKDKTHWPGRFLANTSLPSNYRGDTDWGMIMRYDLASRQQTSTFCDSQILDTTDDWQISKQGDQLTEETSTNISFENWQNLRTKVKQLIWSYPENKC